MANKIKPSTEQFFGKHLQISHLKKHDLKVTRDTPLEAEFHPKQAKRMQGKMGKQHKSDKSAQSQLSKQKDQTGKCSRSTKSSRAIGGEVRHACSKAAPLLPLTQSVGKAKKLPSVAPQQAERRAEETAQLAPQKVSCRASKNIEIEWKVCSIGTAPANSEPDKAKQGLSQPHGSIAVLTPVKKLASEGQGAVAAVFTESKVRTKTISSRSSG